MTLSIILPCKNEAESLKSLLPTLKAAQPAAEIILVNDGSTDDSGAIAESFGIRVIHHPHSLGNGAAIKAGARAAKGEVLVFMDSDGQHDPADIPTLLAKLSEGYQMVVGARLSKRDQAGVGRLLANGLYNRLASWMTEQKILDLTSGFRVVYREKFLEFLSLLPNSFSYPTTITMAFFRSGYPVAYQGIRVHKRLGKSHIRPIKDGVRFLLIIFKIATLYAPMKLFGPVALAHATVGLGYYAFTFFTQGRLSLATLFLLTSAVIIFLIGLLSEQLTQMMYMLAQGKKAGKG
jgi:glycosyltransferase involved in cell wall biosynthesis